MDLSSLLQDRQVLTREDLDRAVAHIQNLFPFNRVVGAGSVYTNGTGNDLDVLVESINPKQDAAYHLSGFTVCASTEYGDDCSADWMAVRNDAINVLLVKPGLFDRWKAAGEMCKWIGSCDKRQRVFIHEVIKNYRTIEQATELSARYEGQS